MGTRTDRQSNALAVQSQRGILARRLSHRRRAKAGIGTLQQNACMLVKRLRGVAVSTLDSERSDRNSNPSEAFFAKTAARIPPCSMRVSTCAFAIVAHT